MAKIRADELYTGDRLDLSGDAFADPAGTDPTYASTIVRVDAVRREGATILVVVDENEAEVRVPHDHAFEFLGHGFDEIAPGRPAEPRRMLLLDWRRRHVVEGTLVALVDRDGVPHEVDCVSSIRRHREKVGRWLDEAVRLGIDLVDMRDPAHHAEHEVPATLDGRATTAPGP